jgi:hypothetical protein
MRLVIAFLVWGLASPVAAQAAVDDAIVLEEPGARRRSPDWTWGLLGTGVGMVVASLGTGLGALLVQLDLDTVCSFTCPTAREEQQRGGRILAITTDVLWMGGAVLGAFGLVAAFTLEEEVPPVAAFCDGSGCVGLVGGRF